MDPQRTRSLWPHGLIVTFAVFIAWIAVFIVIAVRSSQDLVRDDYYEHEVRYQEQIDRETRTAGVAGEVGVDYQPTEDRLELKLPAEHAGQRVTGTLKLYRPSDARLDRELPLSVDESGRQQVDTDGLPGGLWKLHVTWRVGGEEYYAVRTIILLKPSLQASL